MCAATVNAQVRYLNSEWKNRDDRAFIYSKESRRANTSRQDVVITDARDLQQNGDLDLDTNGFVLAPYETAMRDFDDAAAVNSSYASEIAPMLLQLTDAREIYVHSHQTRTESPRHFLNAYSRYLHCDYPLFNITRDRELRILEASGSTLKNEIDTIEYAWYNVWAPVGQPVEQNALTLIDASTVRREDLKEYHFTDAANGGYAAIPVSNPDHRLYYFSKLAPAEAMVFKQYDSRPGKALVCPHTAFYDTNVGDDAAPRRSVEFRALCVF